MPTCNVDGCDDDAVAAIVGEGGYDTAYRCRDCLVFDLGLPGAGTSASNNSEVRD